LLCHDCINFLSYQIAYKYNLRYNGDIYNIYIAEVYWILNILAMAYLNCIDKLKIHTKINKNKYNESKL